MNIIKQHVNCQVYDKKAEKTKCSLDKLDYRLYLHNTDVQCCYMQKSQDSDEYEVDDEQRTAERTTAGPSQDKDQARTGSSKDNAETIVLENTTRTEQNVDEATKTSEVIIKFLNNNHIYIYIYYLYKKMAKKFHGFVPNSDNHRVTR